MATKAQLENALRLECLAKIVQMVDTEYETDALSVSSSEYAIPTTDAEGNDKTILIKVSIPRGTRDGNGGYIPYDPYQAHEDYIIEKESKEQEKAVKKAMKEAEKASKKKKKKDDEEEDE